MMLLADRAFKFGLAYQYTLLKYGARSHTGLCLHLAKQAERISCRHGGVGNFRVSNSGFNLIQDRTRF